MREAPDPPPGANDADWLLSAEDLGLPDDADERGLLRHTRRP
jgi:hypothetical protein